MADEIGMVESPKVMTTDTLTPEEIIKQAALPYLYDGQVPNDGTDCAADIIAALESHGWILAPKEPTEAMLVAGATVDIGSPVWSYDENNNKHYHCTLPGHIYRAMISTKSGVEG